MEAIFGAGLPSMPVREVTLKGNHVTLEPLRLQHADELYPDALEPGLFQHLAPGMEQNKRSLVAWIQQRLEDQRQGTALPFLQRDSATRKAVGCTAMLSISPRNHRLEIGHTWLAKSHRRTHCNTESKLLLLTHAFEEMRAVRVQFKVDVRNETGIRALERFGATREGVMRNERILLDGFIRNAYVYSIIDSEWPEVRKRLHHLLWVAPQPARRRPMLTPDPPTGPILPPRRVAA